jgi:hypothetical protein
VVAGEGDGHLDESDYILFYGNNQTKWVLDSVSNQFIHQQNLYADTTYYFLTVGNSPGSRVQLRSSVAGANQVVDSYDDYVYHESDLYNFLKSGREWFGESMDNLNNSVSFTYSIPNLRTTDSLQLRSYLAGRSTAGGSNYFTLYINGTNMVRKILQV